MDEIKKGFIFTGVILATVLLGYVSALLSPVMAPFLIAMLFAYLANPLVNKISAVPKLKIPRTVSVVIVFLLIISFLTLVLLMVIPMLQNQMTDLIKQLPRLLAWLQHEIIPKLYAHFNLDGNAEAIALFKEKGLENIDTASDMFVKFWKTLLHSGLGLISWGINFGLIFVVAFYLMRDWSLCIKGMKSLLPPKYKEKILDITYKCNDTLGLFFKGQLIVVAALMLIYSLGLSLVGVKYSLLLGLSAGALSIVPYLGGFIGLGMSCLFAMFQSQDMMLLLQVLCVFGVGQLLEGMVLTPILIGDKLGLHPVAVIFALLAGGQLFGFVGILLALPIASVMVILFREHYNRYVLNPVS
jgi:predicted PurR-regulated permease PerM